MRTRSSQSVTVVRCRLGYMQQAVSWWQETGEGIGVDFTIHPCGARSIRWSAGSIHWSAGSIHWSAGRLSGAHTQPEYRIRCHVLFITQVLT